MSIHVLEMLSEGGCFCNPNPRRDKCSSCMARGALDEIGEIAEERLKGISDSINARNKRIAGVKITGINCEGSIGGE